MGGFDINQLLGAIKNSDVSSEFNNGISSNSNLLTGQNQTPYQVNGKELFNVRDTLYGLGNKDKQEQRSALEGGDGNLTNKAMATGNPYAIAAAAIIDGIADINSGRRKENISNLQAEQANKAAQANSYLRLLDAAQRLRNPYQN